ncbi:KR domain-containing protein, partial [Streptomyces buecherae]|uniref:type I polyketide synthase n=1 Tax=Streptomyces buecherae TaxID=2763006 RepID=UPI003404C00A
HSLDQLQHHCTKQEIRHRRIPVDYASHTPHIQPIEPHLTELLAATTPQPAQIPFYSTVHAEPIDTTTLTANYWITNLRTPVHFHPTVEKLLNDGHTHFIETSPHPGLTTAIEETADTTNHHATTHTTLHRDDDTPTRTQHTLAHTYTHGLQPTWHHHTPPAPVTPLPTYPFQHTHYWLNPEPSVAGSSEPVEDALWDTLERSRPEELAALLDMDAGAVAPVVSALSALRQRNRASAALDGLRYVVEWQQWAGVAAAVGRLSGAWLLVSAGGDARRAGLADALAAAGAEVVPVDGAAEVARVVAERPDVAGVLQPYGDAGATLAVLRELSLAPARAPLWVVTSGAVQPTPDDPAPVPHQAQAWGLGLVAALEHPRRWGGLIDLAPGAGPEDHAGLVRHLADSGGEDQVAIRGTAVYRRRLARAGRAADATERRWRPRGTTLITGGTRGRGALVARYLARAGADHLLLTRTDGAPDGAAGSDVTAAELTELGAGRVTVVEGRLADRDAVRGLLDAVPAAQPLRAVLLAADSGAGSALVEASPDGLAVELAERVRGTELLHELTSGAGSGGEGAAELAAFVVFSSVAGVWGSTGQGAHAASVAHLDTLVRARRAAGLPGTSVAWGLWADAPIGGGVAAPGAEAERRALLEQRGVAGLSTEVALAALQQALDRRDECVVVADVDWARFAPVFTSARPSPLLSGLAEVGEALAERGADPAADAGASALRARLAESPPAEWEGELVTLVRTVAAAVLGHAGADAVAGDRQFKDLGFDSLAAVSMRNQLHAATGLRLPTTLVFDHPTPAAVARFLLAELDEAAAGPGSAGAGDGAADGQRPGGVVDPVSGLLVRGALTDARDPAYAEDPARVADAVAAFGDDELFSFIDERLGSFGAREPGRGRAARGVAAHPTA